MKRVRMFLWVVCWAGLGVAAVELAELLVYLAFCALLLMVVAVPLVIGCTGWEIPKRIVAAASFNLGMLLYMVARIEWMIQSDPARMEAAAGRWWFYGLGLLISLSCVSFCVLPPRPGEKLGSDFKKTRGEGMQ